MESEKKTHVVDATSAGSESDFGIMETPPPKVSFGKKLLYHLWDADQHLKSPKACVDIEFPEKIILLTCPQERAFVRKLDLVSSMCNSRLVDEITSTKQS